MTATRKARVPMAEQIRLINECRRSGMTDADWCRENDIAVSTFYNWVSRCRKAVAEQIPPPNYGHLEVPRPKQDVVPIDIVPDHIPEQHTASQMQNSYLGITLVTGTINFRSEMTGFKYWIYKSKIYSDSAIVNDLLKINGSDMCGCKLITFQLICMF